MHPQNEKQDENGCGQQQDEHPSHTVGGIRIVLNHKHDKTQHNAGDSNTTDGGNYQLGVPDLLELHAVGLGSEEEPNEEKDGFVAQQDRDPVLCLVRVTDAKDLRYFTSLCRWKRSVNAYI